VSVHRICFSPFARSIVVFICIAAFLSASGVCQSDASQQQPVGRDAADLPDAPVAKRSAEPALEPDWQSTHPEVTYSSNLGGEGSFALGVGDLPAVTIEGVTQSPQHEYVPLKTVLTTKHERESAACTGGK
jgi:hypothetical protein